MKSRWPLATRDERRMGRATLPKNMILQIDMSYWAIDNNYYLKTTDCRFILLELQFFQVAFIDKIGLPAMVVRLAFR